MKLEGIGLRRRVAGWASLVWLSVCLALTVGVALGLLLVDLVVETEEIDAVGEWRAALHRASLNSHGV
jgi:hypothetical protein